MTQLHPTPLDPTAPTLAATTPAPAFAAFLLARLGEEIAAGRARCAGAVPTEATRRGLRLLDELSAALAAGEPVDRMSVDLLVVAYADHPDFSEAWNRWRVQAG